MTSLQVKKVSQMPQREANSRSRVFGRLRRDQRGSMYIEYVIIMAFAALLVVKFVGPKAGERIVSEYLGRRVILYSTTP